MAAAQTLFMAVPAILFTWATFFAAGLIYFALRYRSKLVSLNWRDLYATLVPWDVRRSKSFHADVKVYVIRKLTDFLFLIPGGAVLASVAAGVAALLAKTGMASYPHGVEISSLVVVALVLTLATEFNAWFLHMLEHKVEFLWELHKVHHAAEHLNPLTNQRAHSLLVLLTNVGRGVFCGIPGGFFMYRWGYGFIELFAIVAVANKLITVITLDPLRHSNFPVSFGPVLDRLVVSPHMHQVHHSSLEQHWDKNFGTNLAIFDWIFGTAYRPKRGEEITFGISGYDTAQLEQYYSLRGTYIDPMVRSVKCLGQVLPGRDRERRAA